VAKKHYLLVAVAALVLAGLVQRHVERRRVEENLTWTTPENKTPLETAFLALGGFRGLVVDVLWLRAIRLQDQSNYYELNLLADLIQQLQPSFPHIHAYLGWNLSYNLANKSHSAEDKWYWIRSGLTTLEKGLERNKRNYLLWFELGLSYADRLGDIKIGSCIELRQKDLCNIDELNEDQRAAVFLKNCHTPSPARPDEHIRWAAYYFFKATQAFGDPLPVRSEREFGNCLDRLGHWASKVKDPVMRKTWEDWGAEDWWAQLRTKHREEPFLMPSLDHGLRWCMIRQMNYFDQEASRLKASDPAKAASFAAKLKATVDRLKGYFPGEQRSCEKILADFRNEVKRLNIKGSNNVGENN
jgi:hypothetical protein